MISVYVGYLPTFKTRERSDRKNVHWEDREQDGKTPQKRIQYDDIDRRECNVGLNFGQRKLEWFTSGSTDPERTVKL